MLGSNQLGGISPYSLHQYKEGIEPSHSHRDLIGFEPNYLTALLACVNKVTFQNTWRIHRESNPGLQFWRLTCYRNTLDSSQWYPEQDLNLRPTPYQDAALPLCYPGVIGGDGVSRTHSARGGGFTVHWGYQFSYISKTLYS